MKVKHLTRFLFLFLLLLLLLAACSNAEEVAPPGNYSVIPMDGQLITPSTVVYEGWTLSLEYPPTEQPNGQEPTPEISTPTQGVPPTLIPQCELHVLGDHHAIYAEPNGTAAVGGIERGMRVEAIRFYYPADSSEWAQVDAVDRFTDTPVIGWILLTENIEQYDPLGPCIDMPAEYEQPLPPTQVPEPTFTPVPTSIPQPEACTLSGPEYNWINMRSLPQIIAGNIVDEFLPGMVTIADAQYSGSRSSGFTWYRIWWPETAEYAWIAHTLSLGVSGDCDGVPELDPFVTSWSTVPPGAHALVGEGSNLVANYAGEMGIVKCLNGTDHICREMKADNPEILTVWRTLLTDMGEKDCPEPWMYDDPSMWWSVIKSRMPYGYDFYEGQNECPPPPGGYEEWVTFSIAMAEYVEDELDGRYLAFSFAPGNPDYIHWEQLAPYFAWVDAHGQETGVWHGVAVHQAVYAPFSRPDMPWVNSAHLAGRHLYIRERVLAGGGPDIAFWDGAIIITEGGLGDGYSGTWKPKYSCDEAAAALSTSIDTWEAQGVIDGITWWNFGLISIWSSDHECLDEMFPAL